MSRWNNYNDKIHTSLMMTRIWTVFIKKGNDVEDHVKRRWGDWLVVLSSISLNEHISRHSHDDVNNYTAARCFDGENECYYER